MKTDTERLDYALSRGSLYTWEKKYNAKGEVYYEGGLVKDRESLDDAIEKIEAESRKV